MGCCSSGCGDSCGGGCGPESFNEEVDQAAENLAVLIEQSAEYQEFVRMAQTVNADEDVKRLILEIRSSQMVDGSVDGAGRLDQLQVELEALPVVQTYRRAEGTVKEMLQQVDAIVSQSSGISFAMNARVNSCGCGGSCQN
ncbi:MAG: YlbF family regulator [Anaerolineae bacterium]|nr:YlbF family regulator [Anaerolineae bacterium]